MTDPLMQLAATVRLLAGAFVLVLGVVHSVSSDGADGAGDAETGMRPQP